MHDITGDRDAVEEPLRDTIRQLEQSKPQDKTGGMKATSATKKGAQKGSSPDDVVDLWQTGLDRIDGKKGGKKSAKAVGLQQTQRPDERAVDTAYAPRDQIIAIFQSAMDEYLDEIVGPAEPGGPQKGSKKASALANKTTKAASAKKGKPKASLDHFYKDGEKKRPSSGAKTKSADIFAQFGNLDPRWVTVVTEKAWVILKGKHEFIKHKSASDFRFKMENETTVAIVGDWGGGRQ